MEQILLVSLLIRLEHSLVSGKQYLSYAMKVPFNRLVIQLQTFGNVCVHQFLFNSYRLPVSPFVRSVYQVLFAVNVVCNWERYVQLDIIVREELSQPYLVLGELSVMWKVYLMSALATFALQESIASMKL